MVEIKKKNYYIILHRYQVSAEVLMFQINRLCDISLKKLHTNSRLSDHIYILG